MDEDALKPKNAKNERVKHTIMNLSSTVPRSYMSQSPKEQRIIDYVDDFQRTFAEIYPQRRPLMLVPQNECGVSSHGSCTNGSCQLGDRLLQRALQAGHPCITSAKACLSVFVLGPFQVRKFVCSSIRPTMLNYSELYDIKTCAKFVSDFIGYEELENPLHYPQYMPSPLSVLNWQGGDCFDLSMVLCSLLIGVGYDAYVVMGYAPKSVTTNNQSKTVCPVLEAESEEQEEERKRARDRKPEEKAHKYTVRRAIVLESKFESQMLADSMAKAAAEAEERRRAEQEVLDDLEEDINGPAEEADEMEGKRVHSWVLVRSGKREVVLFSCSCSCLAALACHLRRGKARLCICGSCVSRCLRISLLSLQRADATR